MMILPHPTDALHKAMIYRLLITILDTKHLAANLYFKGGTAAAMLGWLDRFSIDLDFDLSPKAAKRLVRDEIRKVIAPAGFTITQEAPRQLYFVLRYPAPEGRRRTIKLSIIDVKLTSNIYTPQFLPDIGRYAICQSRETMFANKLVAVTDRYHKYHTIAGRDIYDIHHFFSAGFRYNEAVITERTNLTPHAYIEKLRTFIQKKVTDAALAQDLSTILAPRAFGAIRKTLKAETLLFLQAALG